MPKKIRSFYWASDANCNELRVLRTRPSKLNSGARIIHNFCDSWKARSKKHFQTNKKGKYIAIKDFRCGFINRGKNILREHNITKSKLRPLGKLNRNSSSIPLKKNIVSLNSLRKQHPNRMAVDFDHMYIDCGDSKIALDRDIELQHLKEMSILNLELIQVQDDKLKAKDKIIEALQEEKKNLEARLERIERRLSLQLQKDKELSVPISIQTDFPNDSLNFGINKSGSSPRTPMSPNQRSPYLHKRQNNKSFSVVELQEDYLNSPDTLESKRELRNKHSPSYSTTLLDPRLSPKDKHYLRKDSYPHSPEVLQISTSNLNSNVDDNKKLRSPIHKKSFSEETTVNIRKNRSHLYEVNDNQELIPSPPECEEVTDHSLRSRHKSCNDPDNKDVSYICFPNSTSELGANCREIIQAVDHLPLLDKNKLALRSKSTIVEAPKVRGEGILTTSVQYYLPSNFSDVMDSSEDDYAQVEIPQWRVRNLASLYVMEGTENLEDEIFLKRHQKPEYEERRRKRWDLQRMREQRQYEKLRERYECRNKSATGLGDGNELSLWPPPEGAYNLQVDPELPVCAFGQNLVTISETDFEVPWVSKKAALPVTPHSCRKRKK